jgi:hypothetical protein
VDVQWRYFDQPQFTWTLAVSNRKITILNLHGCKTLGSKKKYIDIDLVEKIAKLQEEVIRKRK